MVSATGGTRLADCAGEMATARRRSADCADRVDGRPPRPRGDRLRVHDVALIVVWAAARDRPAGLAHQQHGIDPTRPTHVIDHLGEGHAIVLLLFALVAALAGLVPERRAPLREWIAGVGG